MAFVFEFGEWSSVRDADDLKRMLENIWSDRFIGEQTDEIDDKSFQPFVQFDGNKIKAKNYSGFIQHNDELIEIYPKVFRNSKCQDRGLMLNHIFYWLSYCRKWKFPFTSTGLDVRDADSFPELTIYLIATQIHAAVTNNPLAQYQYVEEALLMPRGSINFPRYVTNSLAKANPHILECDHESFLLDNKLNRIIKYCTRLLLNQTKQTENIRILQEVIYTLDEVTDQPFSLRDAQQVPLNRFYEEYLNVLDSCRLILGQHLYAGQSYDMSQWCLLLPMEYIFEDFIAGFLETHFSDRWNVEYQKSNLYLSDQPRAFNIQHDIFLINRTNPGRTLIVDAKYKIRDKDFDKDPKRGIAQSDMYQMLSYAYKRGCNEVVLLYPNRSENLKEADCFEIPSGFADNTRIKVKAIEIPFWSLGGFELLNDRLKQLLQSI